MIRQARLSPAEPLAILAAFLATACGTEPPSAASADAVNAAVTAAERDLARIEAARPKSDKGTSSSAAGFGF